MKKTITMILILIISITFIANISYAAGLIDIENVQKPSTMDTSEITDRANVIVTVIRNVGIVISVVALMYIGLKTMTGSLEEKSHYKQALPGYIVGLVMVAAITLLPSIIYNAVSDDTDSIYNTNSSIQKVLNDENIDKIELRNTYRLTNIENKINEIKRQYGIDDTDTAARRLTNNDYKIYRACRDAAILNQDGSLKSINEIKNGKGDGSIEQYTK